MTFDGAGRGVLGTTHGCPVKPTWKLYAVRDGASPVSVNSRISCGTPLKKRSASGALTENAGTTAASGQPVKLIGTPQVTYSLIADRDRRYLSLAALVRLSSKLTAAEQRSMALLAAPGLRDGQTIRQPAGGFFGGTPLGRIGASGSNCYLAEVVQIRRRSALGVRPWKLGLRPAGAGALMPPVKSIKPRRMSGNWEAAAMRRLGCGATPNSSAAGVAPLLVLNRSGNLNNSPSAHVSFRLPPGAWYASRNDGGEVTRNGTYFRRTPVSGKRCVVSVSVAGRGQLHRPLLTTTNKSDHVRRGTAGAVRWLSARSQLPPTPPLPYAKAYSSAPSWAPWRWSAFSFSAQTEYPATAACRRSMLRVDLAAVARSSRVERGSFTDA